MKKLEKSLPISQIKKPELLKAINEAAKKLGPVDPKDSEELASNILNGTDSIPRDKVREGLKFQLPRLPKFNLWTPK